MSDQYRHGPHTVYPIHLHLVWVTKYRRSIVAGEVGPRLRDLVRQICGEQDVLIRQGHVGQDHVHLFVSIPPQLAISRLVQRLKGKTAYKLFQEYPQLRKKLGGQQLWARGYFGCSSGNVTDEVIKQYIAAQAGDTDTTFRVEGEPAE